MNRFAIALAAACCLCSPLRLMAKGRVPWTTSQIVGSPDPATPLHIERVYSNLRFINPVELRAIPSENRMLLLQVDGKLFSFADENECDHASLILDVGEGEEPLRAFGFGLHPNFAENRELFLVYSYDTRNVKDGARLSRFRLPAKPGAVIDRSSEEILLTWTSGGHNGSTIDFDRDGMLYFSAGDGARPFPPDEFNVGQDLSDLRATICRIDVDRRDDDQPYGIPSDNPFVNVPGARGEIWAYGFRNPWRFTIDPPTQQLLCADVGWELWESVFDVKPGGNYGWSLFEGPGALRGDVEQGPTPIQKPIAAYNHSLGQSITGGIVYRGSSFPELDGVYLYGDYVSGLLWGLRQADGVVSENPLLGRLGIPIITFAQDGAGEALVVSYDGEVYRLVRNPLIDQPNRFPRRLSETGLFESLIDLSPAPGVYPYKIAAESYDGRMEKRFHVAIPNRESIKTARQKRGWRYPIGTVFVRTFLTAESESVTKSPTKVETQVLHFDGMTWHPYSFMWNESQDDAELTDGKGGVHPMPATHQSSELRSTRDHWSIHSRNQCRSCHTKQTGGAVGFSYENLASNTIERFVDLGILNQSPPEGWKIRKMVTPTDPTASLDDRARSYLAANCAHCHRRGGGGSVPLELEFSRLTDQINAVGVDPMQGSFGIDRAKVIAAGDPLRSVMLYRMSTSGMGRMPKLALRDPDDSGILLIHDWIRSLSSESQLSQSPQMKLSSTSQAMSNLIHVLSHDQPHAAIDHANQARQQGDVMIEGLFERFLPKNERRQQLGPDIDRDAILEMQGDSARGEKWLTETGGTQCISCHRVNGQGKNVGPGFDAIGSKRSRKDLLESIVDPSATIEPKYQNRMVLTDDGSILAGFIVSENNESITIRTADGRDISVERDSIESQRNQPQSLMPTGLAETMTARELADLLAYLSSLK